MWTAIVRSGSEAPTRIKGGAGFLRGVGFWWRWAVLAWAAMLVAIVMSFRPAVPVIWGDTPPFLESANRVSQLAGLELGLFVEKKQVSVGFSKIDQMSVSWRRFDGHGRLT